MTFCIRFFTFSSMRSYPVPSHLNQLLEQARTPEQIEMLISEYESQLAQLDNECDDFLVCDSAAELMADVLQSKEIDYQIICGSTKGQRILERARGKKRLHPAADAAYQAMVESYNELVARAGTTDPQVLADYANGRGEQ